MYSHSHNSSICQPRLDARRPVIARAHVGGAFELQGQFAS
jgi:hypothetical protein